MSRQQKPRQRSRRRSERPLVVVSNRLPFSAVRRGGRLTFVPSAGGLVAALEPALRQHGGVWIGWPGIARDASPLRARYPAAPGVRYRAVPLTTHEVNLYYGEFANRTIWPLFHYFVGRTHISRTSWRVYERVNERIAEAAAAEAEGAQLVWIHDYHLLRVPHYLRRLKADCPIAFFLHVPFPDADVFRVLPWAQELLEGLLQSDLVAFQVPSHAANFLTCVERLLGLEVDREHGLVHFEGAEVAVQAHPISIDFGRIAELAATAPPRPQRRMMEVLGVDRLDYTKGIPERLLAVERLLERHPEWRKRVRFTQLLVPSRERVPEYRELKRTIDEMVGRINGRFSEEGWSPIRYLVRSLPTDELVTLYRQADVALVTPLRDGMNLVAKEYVAAHRERDGVLILSEMAGAAEQLPEALLVNPFDVDAVADSLHHALDMPSAERRARMATLRGRVQGDDVHAWTTRFLAAALAGADARKRAARSGPLEHVQQRLGPWLAQRPTTALFLDYDGTLTPIVDQPEAAVLSDSSREALRQAATASNLTVAVVSGRALADVKQMVGLPNLTYVGNHGFEITGPDLAFRHEGVGRFEAAIVAAAAALERAPISGTVVERKGLTLTVHVRHVRPTRRARAERQAATILRRFGLHVTRGIFVVEGRPPLAWHKGSAVLHVLTHRYGAEWPELVRAVYVGDDRTDEDACRSLRGIGRSVWVASGSPAEGTAADFRLPDTEAVISLLRWIGSGSYRMPSARPAGSAIPT